MGSVVGQISLFDLIPFTVCQKSQEQLDIDTLVRKGSGFRHGKIRILAFYQINQPSTKEFADFLKNEYGQGGESNGKYSEMHNSSGISIEFKSDKSKYKFSWPEFAKLVAKSIEEDEYMTESDLPENEYYEARYIHGNYTHLLKNYYFGYAYDGRKIVKATLHSCTEDVVKGKMVDHFSNRYSHVDISISEVIRAIESGAYDNVKDIWEDIKYSGRMVSPTAFGGKRWLDEKAINGYFDCWKKTGSVHGDGKKVCEDFDDRDRFYNSRLRVSRGEISKEFFDQVRNVKD